MGGEKSGRSRTSGFSWGRHTNRELSKVPDVRPDTYSNGPGTVQKKTSLQVGRALTGHELDTGQGQEH